ncbi:MAG: response regulator [Candidatus Dormibacterales bacterium]
MAVGIAMIVDDNEASALLAETLLELAGFDVRVVASAEEALMQIRASRPDVVIVDLLLPGLDGLGFARVLRGDPEIASIPLIGVTAAEPSYYRAAGLATLCDGFINKPIQVATFAEEVLGIVLRRIGAPSVPGDVA